MIWITIGACFDCYRNEPIEAVITILRAGADVTVTSGTDCADNVSDLISFLIWYCFDSHFFICIIWYEVNMIGIYLHGLLLSKLCTCDIYKQAFKALDATLHTDVQQHVHRNTHTKCTLASASHYVMCQVQNYINIRLMQIATPFSQKQLRHLSATSAFFLHKFTLTITS